MTEILQKTENVAKNVANENSQDLTEQWKKGELPDGEYYCKTENGDEILRTWRGLNGYVSLENICDEVFIASMDDCEVLDKVPSHKEYQKLLSDQLAKNEGVEINAELEAENTKLKGLLKEVQSKIRYSSPRGIETFADLDDTLLGKINQVLGEE